MPAPPFSASAPPAPVRLSLPAAPISVAATVPPVRVTVSFSAPPLTVYSVPPALLSVRLLPSADRLNTVDVTVAALRFTVPASDRVMPVAPPADMAPVKPPSCAEVRVRPPVKPVMLSRPASVEVASVAAVTTPAPFNVSVPRPPS